MNLQALTQAHVSPARIQEYLDKHFERVVIMQARNSDHGHAFTPPINPVWRYCSTGTAAASTRSTHRPNCPKSTFMLTTTSKAMHDPMRDPSNPPPLHYVRKEMLHPYPRKASWYHPILIVIAFVAGLLVGMGV